MLKPIFDEDVDFFSKKIILCAKGGDFKKGALDSDFMFINIEPYKSKKCVPLLSYQNIATLTPVYLMTKNAAILDTKMAVTFELLALEQKGKVFWMHDTFLCNLV